METMSHKDLPVYVHNNMALNSQVEETIDKKMAGYVAQ